MQCNYKKIWQVIEHPKFQVVSIDLIHDQIYRFCYNGVYNECLELSICNVIVRNHTMKNKSSISLGGTTILLALFAQENMFGQIRQWRLIFTT